ncbi:MAG: elongation factor G [Chloroflexi bacterium]|nr:elongation factor G [Chloroflexota bacterium]
MPQFDTAHLRNVVLLGHSGSGKTSLAEALLFTAGAISRLGKVDDGTTSSDYEPEEVRRRSSIQTSLLPCVWQGHKVNVLDTPGYPDFEGEVLPALRAADAALLVVSAPSGVEVGTEKAWALCQEAGKPCMVFINKMDRENADAPRVLASLNGVLGGRCVAVQVAVGSQQAFREVWDLVSPPAAAIPEELQGDVAKLGDRLLEAIAETDDALATKYLEGEAIGQDELLKALREAIGQGRFVPVLMGSSLQCLGMRELLDAMVRLLPSPAEVPPVEANGGGQEPLRLPADPEGPLAALVFKTTADPFVGRLSYFRVFSGALRSDSQVWNVTKGQQERIGQVFVPRGKVQEQVERLVAGDIGAVAKLSAAATGDTLAQRDRPLSLFPIKFPAPVYTAAIYPKSKADLDKMTSSLARLVEEDPTLQMQREPSTGETLLSGLGDTHVEVAVEKARRKFGVELLVAPPKVPYRESIGAFTRAEYKHKKQTGGHGQYGHVMIELEPLPRGSGFEFAERVVGGNVPKEYRGAVEKGITKALPEGVLAGYPIVDLRVVLYDGSSHPVDSSNMSFEIAGSHALRKGVSEARPTLLEPVMRLQVRVPDQYTGEIMGDLNSKRGRILGMVPQSGTTTVEAEAPQAELLHYALDLRAMTQGRGSFQMSFARYEEVPPHLVPRIVEQAKRTPG